MPKLKKIKSLDEIPSWFNLKNYDSYKKLKAIDWLDQLSARKNIQIAIAHAINNEKSLKYFMKYLINENDIATPLIDTNMDSETRWSIQDERLSYIKAGGSFLPYSKGVHQMTIRELFHTDISIPDDENQQAKAYFHQRNKPADEWDYEELQNSLKWDEKFEQPVDNKKTTYSEYATLMVNMDLEEKVLVEQFKSELAKIRENKITAETDKELKHKKIQKFDPEAMVNFGVIPFLDLSIWASINRVEIPGRLYADCIFQPGEGDPDRVDYIKKEWVEKVTSEKFLSKLAALAAE